MQTELQISIGGFTPMSARNCSQELFPVSSGTFYRDVNGKLVFISKQKNCVYKTIITGNDKNPPAFSGIAIGSIINVGCIQYIWKKVDKGIQNVELERPMVNGSAVVINEYNEYLDFIIKDEKSIQITNNKDGAYVGFRPWLVMQVLDFKIETDEWGMNTKWRIVLEEV